MPMKLRHAEKSWKHHSSRHKTCGKLAIFPTSISWSNGKFPAGIGCLDLPFPPQPGRKPTKRKSLGIAVSNGDGPGPWRPVGEPGQWGCGHQKFSSIYTQMYKSPVQAIWIWNDMAWYGHTYCIIKGIPLKTARSFQALVRSVASFDWYRKRWLRL